MFDLMGLRENRIND